MQSENYDYEYTGCIAPFMNDVILRLPIDEECMFFECLTSLESILESDDQAVEDYMNIESTEQVCSRLIQQTQERFKIII